MGECGVYVVNDTGYFKERKGREEIRSDGREGGGGEEKAPPVFCWCVG